MVDNINEDDDELMDDFADGGDDFDGFEQPEKGTLGDLWRNNPVARIGVIALAVIFIFGTIIIFSGGDADPDRSVVSGGSNVSSTPGGENASEAYIDAVEDKNEQRFEEAVRTGGSALPTPIDPPVGRVNLPLSGDEEEDPLQRWRRLQEERLERELQVQETISPDPIPEDTSNAELVQRLADGFVQQMQSVLERQGVPPMNYRGMTGDAYLDSLEAEEEERLAELDLPADSTDPQTDIIIGAGEIHYAQIITEANTDSPGPVLAQLVSGPLKGSRIIGQFTAQRETLTLAFSTVVVNKESVGINAVALDPDTTLPGLATEVDHRYLKRVFLPAAAAFVEGLTTAIADSGRTTVTIQGETVAEETAEASDGEEVATGIAEAGEEIREIIDEIVDETEVLIKIDRGTPMGILFLDPVTQETGN
jgi:intracellular multiplication protein IcmE